MGEINRFAGLKNPDELAPNQLTISVATTGDVFISARLVNDEEKIDTRFVEHVGQLDPDNSTFDYYQEINEILEERDDSCSNLGATYRVGPDGEIAERDTGIGEETERP